MGVLFGILLQLAVLWILILVFTGSINSDQSYRETFTVVFGINIVGFLVGFAVYQTLGKGYRAIPVVAEIAALFFLIEWACGTQGKTTIKIWASFIVISALIRVGFYYLGRA